VSENIKIKNIYYMLSYAFQSLRETGLDSLAQEEFENIHDLFSAILARGIGSQIKRGLHRDFISREETLAGLRGQIRVSETIKQQSMIQGKLVCAYDEFSEDTYHNEILKSTMLLLLRYGHVKPENRKALRKLLLYFGDIREIPVTSVRWDALKYHRNNWTYRMLMNICRFVIKGLLQTTEKGVNRLASWLQDEEMHRLYERFVLSYYQTHHSEFKPRAAFIDWDLTEAADMTFLPKMKSDITLTYGNKRLIIDTKCYSHTMQLNSLFDSTTFISSNLYQIYTYVKNSDINRSGDVAGVLLYAKTDEVVTPDGDFIMGGNRIGLKSLDLSQEWVVITSQLEMLCSWLDAEG
jgi:5-methylcytosine-specific restriction enzyme subunit McrC